MKTLMEKVVDVYSEFNESAKDKRPCQIESDILKRIQKDPSDKNKILLVMLFISRFEVANSRGLFWHQLGDHKYDLDASLVTSDVSVLYATRVVRKMKHGFKWNNIKRFLESVDKSTCKYVATWLIK